MERISELLKNGRFRCNDAAVGQFQEDVLDAVGAGVLSLGGHRPGCGTGDGDGIREVVFIGRTGREHRVNAVVRVERTAALRLDDEQLSYLDYYVHHFSLVLQLMIFLVLL